MTLPALAQVESALRKTTEVLASELACPSATAPDWSTSEWRVARAAASLHGVSALLARVLRWQGSGGWVRFLEDQRAHTASRHRRTLDLLSQIDSRAREEQIALVPLKGAALYAIGLYEPGTRPMADLDLLAREEDTQRTIRMLEALGFHETCATWKHRVFEPQNCPEPSTFGEHAANGLKIELHSQIREMLPLRPVDVSELVFSARPHPGLNDYPSRAALMTHLLLHAAGALTFRALRLLHLHDIARLSSRMTELDWTEFLTRGVTADRTLWWAWPPLALTARYFSCIPHRVLLEAATDCPWLLKRAYERRRLPDVSLSHFWIDAFPGIEWAQSIGEMLAYAARRVAPSAETTTLRKIIASTQPIASQDTWAHMSQGLRILRWMTSHPTRAETLHAVRAAFAQPH